MSVNNWPKLVVQLVTITCLTVLTALNKIGPEVCVPAILFIAGYSAGNGVAAKRNEPVEPIFGHKDKESE